MTKIIYVAQLEKFIDDLGRIPEKIMPYAQKAMLESLRLLQERFSEYPPSSEANAPGRIDKDGRPMGYYERGRGWWYPVLRSRSLGNKRGVSEGALSAKQAAKQYRMKSVPIVAGYKLAGGGTSEMLGRSWDVGIQAGKNEIVGLVKNNASYADFVQGPGQAQIHKMRGWKPISQSLDESVAEIEEIFSDWIGKAGKQSG